MIEFYCPDFYFGIQWYDYLFTLYEQHPEIFNDNIKISKIYGNFPGAIWNSGNIIVAPQLATVDNIKNTIQYFYDKRIPLQFTMTNTAIKETDVYDRYCNKILELGENDLNEVLVASPILEKYIRKKYPKYKIIKSIISTEQDENYLAIVDKYEKIVLPRRLLKNYNYLFNEIPYEYRNKFELLCNDSCPINCKNLYNHYKSYAKFNLYEKSVEEMIDPMSCPIYNSTSLFPLMDTINEQITLKEIYEIYYPQGYTTYKLSSRGSETIVIFGTIRYLIKPEYQILVLGQYLFNKDPNYAVY